MKNRYTAISLFDHVAFAYADREQLDNTTLYGEVGHLSGIGKDTISEKSPIGQSGQARSVGARKIRWYQQTLKQMGLLEKVEDMRGVWRLTNEGRKKVDSLKRINDGFSMLAFSTKLGIAIWGDARSVFSKISEPITLCLSSPPYPLKNPRAYGNPSESEYVDWLCLQLEPIIKNLTDEGSIVLNVGNDVFEAGMPSRSLYRERLVLALCDRFGLHKMDEIPWVNLSKAPGPLYWASINRQQLNVGWEPVYWFANNPLKCKADNRRVLQPHSEKHKKYLAAGGGKSDTKRTNGDGAYSIRDTSFSNSTEGKIPKNVYIRGHRCADQERYRRICQERGIPTHGAPFPLEMADFFVKYLSEKGDIVIDPFCGSGTLVKAAENNERKWIATDVMHEYLYGSALRLDADVIFGDNIK